MNFSSPPPQVSVHRDWDRADWELYHFATEIDFLHLNRSRDELIRGLNPQAIDLLWRCLRDIVDDAADNSVPNKRTSSRPDAKPWWTPELDRQLAEYRRARR